MSADPFLGDESSVEDSLPREGIEIVMPTVTYLLATGDQDIEIGGRIFVATGGTTRSEFEVSSSGGTARVPEVWIPLSHPVAQRWLQDGVPPKSVTITIWRKQLRSGAFETFHTGEALEMAIDERDQTAKFSVPSPLMVAIRRKLPTITAGRNCPNTLFDENCKASLVDFSVLTTVVSVDGPFVTVASMGTQPDQWAALGALIHIASGEDIPIKSQIGVDLILQLPIPGMAVGDQVRVAAGCDLSIQTCRLKFDNKANFRGFNLLPRGNPFVPTGLGVYTSE